MVFHLDDVTKLVKRARGSVPRLKALIKKNYWSRNHTSARNKEILSMNTALSIKSYGLIEYAHGGDTFKTTDLFASIAKLQGPANEKKRQVLLVRHLLLKSDGLILVKAILQLHADRIKINLEKIARKLNESGIDIKPTSGYISTMKQWLACAGIISSDDAYTINHNSLQKVLGLAGSEIERVSRLSKEQVLFLQSLLALRATKWTPATQVRDYCMSLTKADIPAKALSTQILDPLAEIGFIKISKTTSGRGAKSHRIKLAGRVQSKSFRQYLEKFGDDNLIFGNFKAAPLDRVLRDLKSTSIHKKGMALEDLAEWILRLLRLESVGRRARTMGGSGGELDVLAQSLDLLNNRWQVQCKNTIGIVDIGVIAKEVGLSLQSRADVILIVTTGRFSSDAKKYADSILRTTRHHVILIDGDELKEIVKSPASITNLLREKAERAKSIVRFGEAENFETDETRIRDVLDTVERARGRSEASNLKKAA